MSFQNKDPNYALCYGDNGMATFFCCNLFSIKVIFDIHFAQVLATLAETMKKGTSVGAPCLLENTLAEMVISAVPSIEMIRFVNSGTEACMGALRLARAFTGKQKIIKFEGCSHAMLILFLLRQVVELSH